MATSDLAIQIGPDAVLPLGDAQYNEGSYEDYVRYYGQSWGRFLTITRPAASRRDYNIPDAHGYFDYFNGPGVFSGRAGDRDKGFYSFDIGNWHVIALNSNCDGWFNCEDSGAQVQWLRADLAANPNKCTLAYFNRPHFSTYCPGDSPFDFWRALYGYGADVIVNGMIHSYERFAPLTPFGSLDVNWGIREFVVGTGGRSLEAFPPDIPDTSEIRNDTTFGVLKLMLHDTSYEWEFVPVPGQPSFTDRGSGTCHLTDRCGFNVPTASRSFLSAGGSGAASVGADSGCSWEARSSVPWIAITSGSSGRGSGTVNFSVSPNPDALPRIGSVVAANYVIPIIQRGTSNTQRFTDVPPSNTYFDYITMAAARNFVTADDVCGAGRFCPDANGTRGEFTAFLIRALAGENFTLVQERDPYFTDVPVTHRYFRYIQKAKELGIGNTCSLTQFCPQDSMTRREAAAFIVPAKINDNFNYSQNRYFDDIDYSDDFFGHIQRMNELGISTGCSPRLYCPADRLSRGEEAAFVIRFLLHQGFFWSLWNPLVPCL